MVKATGLISLLLDVALSRDVPFGIPQYAQCMHRGLTFVLICVPFIFAKVSTHSSTMHGFPTFVHVNWNCLYFMW